MKVNNRNRPRQGFTLIEMLVVILIIAVLVALTAGVVLKILGKGPEVQRRSDISQLSDAIAQFRQVFKLTEPPPSRFALRMDITAYTTDKLEAESKLFLQKIFSYRIGLDQNGNKIPLAWAGYDASGNPIPFAQPTYLSGDQCLVFFLGGITDGSPPVCQGFSSNSRNPTAQGGERKGPFYNFESNRLVQSNGFYSYNDPYGTQARPNVYAYFSSYKTNNGYNRYKDASGNPVSDCANPNLNPPLYVWPYYSSAGKYYNPKSFQIISAGKDLSFGCNDPNSRPWSPGNLSDSKMEDDLSNFYDYVLGAK